MVNFKKEDLDAVLDWNRLYQETSIEKLRAVMISNLAGKKKDIKKINEEIESLEKGIELINKFLKID